MGLIDFETFLSKSDALIEEYYRDGKISAKEYYDYVKQMLETQKSIYDKVLSAVTKRFENTMHATDTFRLHTPHFRKS